jgi:hypothetical protein
MGLTGGTTYMAGQNVVNYQILMGAKMILWGGYLSYYYFLHQIYLLNSLIVDIFTMQMGLVLIMFL